MPTLRLCCLRRVATIRGKSASVLIGHWLRRVPVPALLAILATTLFGALDEGIQVLLPSRVFDPVDILFNFLAGVMAIIAMVVLGWARRRFRKAHTD